MATVPPSPSYRVLDASAGIARVTMRGDTYTAEVRTSGWVEIEGQVYAWEAFSPGIPLRRLTEQAP